MSPDLASSASLDWPAWRSPKTHRPLVRRGDALSSPDGGERYPVRNEIPRFVDDAAYVDSFGAQWNRFRLTQVT